MSTKPIPFLWFFPSTQFDPLAVAEIFAGQYVGYRNVKAFVGRWIGKRYYGGFCVGKDEYELRFDGAWKVYGEREGDIEEE